MRVEGRRGNSEVIFGSNPAAITCSQRTLYTFKPPSHATRSLNLCIAHPSIVAIPMAKKFHALPGFYQTLFMNMEPGQLITYSSCDTISELFHVSRRPVSTTIPVLMIYIFPGATWFHHQLVPSSAPAPPSGFLDSRTEMAIGQLGNCSSSQITAFAN